MEWTVVKVDQKSGKNVPFVSIGRGMLDFNAVACSLIDDHGQYKYAKLFTGKENGKTVVAVRFLCAPEADSIPVRRKTQKGKPVQGMMIVNKGVVKDLFGKDGLKDGMVRHGVELVDAEMLKILD